jgi:phosphatidate cytidylyltransferase
LNELRNRILTGALLIPVFLGFLYFGGILLSLFILISLLVAYREYLALLKKIYGNPPVIMGYTVLITLILVFLSVRESNTSFYVIVGLTLLMSAAYPFYFSRGIGLPTFSAVFFGSIYLSIGGSSVFWIRSIGFTTVLFLFLIIWTFDTGAYATGILFGKKKLFYTVSPGKTVEGLLGGLFIAFIVGIGLFYFGLYPTSSILKTLFIILVICGASQLGDLMESALKREAGVKDTSALLPGHGGALDRIDSILLAAPSYWLLLELLR